VAAEMSFGDVRLDLHDEAILVVGYQLCTAALAVRADAQGASGHLDDIEQT
jgi:hypothetical protein